VRYLKDRGQAMATLTRDRLVSISMERRASGYPRRRAPQPRQRLGSQPGTVEGADNKRVWVARHLGDHVEVRCCWSRDKCKHATPGDVLIDDWVKYGNLWIEAAASGSCIRAPTAELTRTGL
jgi:hypothetical protein